MIPLLICQQNPDGIHSSLHSACEPADCPKTGKTQGCEIPCTPLAIITALSLVDGVIYSGLRTFYGVAFVHLPSNAPL